MIRKKSLILSFILLLGLLLRLYRIDNPIADWHSWRQADTSAVTRNFIKFGFDLLHPRFDDLSNIPSGKDNPQGFRFVEFPIYNAASLFLIKLLPQFNLSIEIWQRLVSIFSSLFSIYLVFLICKRYLGIKTALFAAFFLSVLPFNIYYSRAILPEPMMVAASLAMIYFFEKNLWISAFFGSIAFLLKPFAAFFFIPIAYLWIREKGAKFKEIMTFILYGLIVVLPFALWRWWMGQYPEGIPAWKWLLNSDGIRFKGAFFYWLFAERLGKLILGYWGLPLLFLGILVKPEKKEGWFFQLWGIAMLLYITIFATGNVKHDYYQIILIPIIAIYLAKGADFLLSFAGRLFNRWGTYSLLVVTILFMLAFSWYHVRSYYWINRPEIVKAGIAANRLLPKDAKVIAPYNGDTAFLYQINRQGWPVGLEIDEKIRKGATHYVTVNLEDGETKELLKDYKVLERTDDYIIFDLRGKK